MILDAISIPLSLSRKWTISAPIRKSQVITSEATVLIPAQYSIGLYGDTLFTSNKILKEKPDVVVRFRRATLKGWQYARANQEEVVN